MGDRNNELYISPDKNQIYNTGDVLINQALINELRKYGQLCANCSSSIQDEFIDELGILFNEKVVLSSRFIVSFGVIKMALFK